MWAPLRPSGQMSCLCRPGECSNLTYGLHCHMGSSGWSPGLWWGSNSPGDPGFAAQVPVILGTTMISHVMNVIKEKEIDNLAIPWVNARVAYLLVVQQATATVEDNKGVAGGSNPTDYNEVLIRKDMETIDAFSSHIILWRPRQLTLAWGWMWWLKPYVPEMEHYPRA